MKSIKKITTLLTLVVTLTACSVVSTQPAISATSALTPQPVKLIEIINNEQPDFQTSFFSLLLHAGCSRIDQSNRYKCDMASELLKLGCEFVIKEATLDGLTPDYPIAGCVYEFPENTDTENIPPGECFQIIVRLMETSCQQYIIFKNETFLVVKNMAELQSIFAPVDSPEEALGFALLSNNEYSALYGQTQQTSYVYYIQTLEDTFVETSQDGYLVHLFHTPPVGCGPFETEAVKVKVTRDGQVEEINRQPVYRDSTLDHVCID